MSTYKTRRDEAATYSYEVDKDHEYAFKAGADWARADLMKQVEEILVKALEKVREGFSHAGSDVAAALTAWEAIKGER